MSSLPNPAALEHEARARSATALPDRERAVEIAVGSLFVVAALALLLLGDGRADGAVLIVLIAAFAVTVRAQFDVGGGFVSPTQLVFVPALLLEPPRLAPCIVLAGWTLGRLPDVLGGKMHPTRLALLPGDCLYALGPAALLVLAGVSGTHWSDWPWYVAALAAQFAMDFAGGLARGAFALRIPVAEQLRAQAYVWTIDIALAPIGLLAAFASADWRFAFIGVLPLAILLMNLSRERSRRLASELDASREREALIAGASHELQTPLAILSGLLTALVRDPAAPADRRAQSYDAMNRQAAHLRYLVGQFVDYARIRAGQELLVTARATPLDPLLQEVAALWEPDLHVEVRGDGAQAQVDRARLHRALMSLIANAARYAPAGSAVRMTTRREGDTVLIEVADEGPGLAEGRLEEVFQERRAGAHHEGLGAGLLLARASLRAQGGDVSLRNAPTGGLIAAITLPAAGA